MKESKIIENINSRLGIDKLNEMQTTMLSEFSNSYCDITLLSPTGSGKTIAYLIPILKSIKNSTGKVQSVIIAPSRELAIQIENIAKTIASDIKATACYGGHNVIDEKQSLSVVPDIIIATPGRLLDHVNRRNVDIRDCRFLVLDEFDKSLELGFHDEMEKLLSRMPNLSRKILTSATILSQIPDFLKLKDNKAVDFLHLSAELRSRLTILETRSPEKDKLNTLAITLNNIAENCRVIVFVNHKDAGMRVYEYLKTNRYPVGLYNGGLDQIEREKAIEMFNGGTFKILVSTDLGARGLDISDVEHIIHYHLPLSAETFTHRNGRAARVDASGSVHVITGPDEKLPDYIKCDAVEQLAIDAKSVLRSDAVTLYFNAGKKEKISKGDIMGFLINKGNLSKEQIGTINSHDHYSLVAVKGVNVKELLSRITTEKIKNKKVKIVVATQRF